MRKTLYICYFGVRQPLVQTQVIPYLLEIAKDDVGVSLLTFEPDELTPSEGSQVARELAAKGIQWDSLRYHKRLPVIATAYDVFQGSLWTARMLKKERYDVLHARVHIPMLIAAIARILSSVKPKLLFDIRGFFPEEYTDAGVWKPNGLLYRTVKVIERWLMKEADGFVVLTEKARSILFPESAAQGFDHGGRPVEVIPCCVDLKNRFPSIRNDAESDIVFELDLAERFVLTHVGALGGLYLTEDIANFLAIARKRRPNTFALFLTQTDPSLIIRLLANREFSENDYLVRKVPPAEVPNYLRATDAALSFVKASFSTQSRSPTKNAEYLACGVPVIANDGVGDTTEQIIQDRTGTIIREFNEAAYDGALNEIDELLSDDGLAARCRESAAKRFDLETVGGRRYRRLYAALLGSKGN